MDMEGIKNGLISDCMELGQTAYFLNMYVLPYYCAFSELDFSIHLSIMFFLETVFLETIYRNEV